MDNLIWTKTYGGPDEDAANDVIQTTDGGYLAAGYTYSFGAGNSDIYLVKTDSNGDTLWTRAYGNSAMDYANAVFQTTDGGFVILGTKDSLTGSNKYIYVIKTNSSGVLQWTKAITIVSGHASAYDGQQTSDGGLIITGYIYHAFGGLAMNAFLIKMDINGNLLWANSFGGPSDEWANSVEQTADGGYIVAGQTYSFGAGSQDVYLVKTNSAGTVLWSKTFGGSGSDQGTDVKQTSDGGYIVCGSKLIVPGDRDAYLIKTDAVGNMTWSSVYGGSAFEDAYHVQQTGDGGYLLAGGSSSFSALNNRVYLIKVNSGGNSGCNESAATTIQNSPVSLYTVPTLISAIPSTIVSNTSTVIGSDSTFNLICVITAANEVASEKHAITLSPNPTTNELTIDNGELKIEKVEIYNVLGEKTFSQISNLKSQISVDVSQLPSGIYFVKVKEEKEERIAKFIKQ